MNRALISFGLLCGVAAFCQGWQMPNLAGQAYPQGQDQNMQLQGLGFQPAEVTQRSSIPHLMPGSVNGQLAPSTAMKEPEIKGGRHPDDDKRYSIEKLNQAARRRNPFLDTLGGDPYGYSSNVLTRSHIAVRPKSKRSVSSIPAAQPYNGNYANYQTNQQNEKHYDVATLNQAARHRNVYLDTLGADPYGGSSSIVTRQHISVNHHHNKRDTEQEKTQQERKSESPLKKRLGLY